VITALAASSTTRRLQHGNADAQVVVVVVVVEMNII